MLIVALASAEEPAPKPKVEWLANVGAQIDAEGHGDLNVGVRSGATFDRVAVDRFVALAHARATVLSARAARPAPSVTRRWPPGAVAQRCAA